MSNTVGVFFFFFGPTHVWIRHEDLMVQTENRRKFGAIGTSPRGSRVWTKPRINIGYKQVITSPETNVYQTDFQQLSGLLRLIQLRLNGMRPIKRNTNSKDCLEVLLDLVCTAPQVSYSFRVLVTTRTFRSLSLSNV